MSSQKRKPRDDEIIDAEYSLQRDDGSRRMVRPLSANPAYPVVATGGKIVAKGALWVIKNMAIMVVDGIKGVISGVAEANKEMNDEYKRFNTGLRETQRTDKGNSKGGNDYYFVPRSYRRERPFWHIPTKEEEYLDMLKDRGVI